MKFTKGLSRKILLVSVFVLMVGFLFMWYFTATLPDRLRAAEIKAHAFCDAIAIGSDISTVVSRAKAGDIFFGTAGGYTFYFPATGFDKAVCEVTVNRDGVVSSKDAVMEYD